MPESKVSSAPPKVYTFTFRINYPFDDDFNVDGGSFGWLSWRGNLFQSRRVFFPDDFQCCTK